jgi:two-component system sensor histidine kinase BaeS
MEPPSRGPVAPVPPQPGPMWLGPPLAPPARLPYQPKLVVRAGADRRLVIGAIAGGICLDIAARHGLATIAGTAWVIIAAAAILLAGRLRGRAGRVLVVLAAAAGVILAFSSSPWVIAPATAAIVLLMLLGASLGADGSGLSATFPALGTRIALAAGHLACAPGMLRFRGEPAAEGAARKRAAAIARGALLAVPVVLVVGVLLASADPIFRSWFDLRAVIQHLMLAVIGAWAVVGLARAASAARPSPPLPSSPSLGNLEATIVLGGLCALYAAFAGAQFVALSAGGRYVLITRGLTYAQYARSGFFQLLACAAITFAVLLGVRACASAASRAVMYLSGLTVGLTIGVVFIAVRRLQLYEAAFGLTMLRLACLAAAVWIGVVFLLLGSTIPGRGMPRRLLPAAVIVAGLVFAGAWSFSNPAAIVARTNLGRAEHGHRLDVSQAASLGPDAVPALVAGLSDLDASQASELRRAICARSPGNTSGGTFNWSRIRASDALARACGSPG